MDILYSFLANSSRILFRSIIWRLDDEAKSGNIVLVPLRCATIEADDFFLRAELLCSIAIDIPVRAFLHGGQSFILIIKETQVEYVTPGPRRLRINSIHSEDFAYFEALLHS